MYFLTSQRTGVRKRLTILDILSMFPNANVVDGEVTIGGDVFLLQSIEDASSTVLTVAQTLDTDPESSTNGKVIGVAMLNLVPGETRTFKARFVNGMVGGGSVEGIVSLGQDGTGHVWLFQSAVDGDSLLEIRTDLIGGAGKLAFELRSNNKAAIAAEAVVNGVLVIDGTFAHVQDAPIPPPPPPPPPPSQGGGSD